MNEEGLARGHGGGHHGGGHGHASFRPRFGGGRFGWGWGPEIVVVQNETPVCVWREVGALPAYVFGAFANTPRTILGDGTAWTQVFAGNRWWAEHTSPNGASAVFYECDFSGSGLAGLPNGEKTMQAPTTGLGAVHIGTPRGLLLAGLGAIGLGIPGPWGANPSGIAAGGYEITGTQVALRKTAGTGGEEIGRFNPIESSPNIVAGTPDQVDFAGSDAQNATATANGLTWAFVNVKTGPLAGKQGFVAMEYMGPVGYAASHNGTGPAPNIQPQPGPTPSPSDQTASSKSNAIPWIIGGLAVAGLLVGGVIMTKKHRARRAGSHHAVGHHAPAHAHEARRRRRRRR